MTLLTTNLEMTFLKEWLRAPLRVGAVAPSGSRLASAMTEGISGATGPIVELGPGTGAFTRRLLDRGMMPSEIAAIEVSSRFAKALRLKFPGIRVIEGDASQIERLSPFPTETVDKVICGLPFLSMPGETVEQIVLGSARLLHPYGSLRLFTYGLNCPLSEALLERGKLRARRISRTLFNVPPASIYEVRKKC